MRLEPALGIVRIRKETRIVAQREPEGRRHIQPGPPVEVGAPRQQEIVVDVGQHARGERPEQRAGWKPRTQQDRRRGGKPHRQPEGLRGHHLTGAACRHRHDIERGQRCGREQLERDALKAGDVTSQMSVVDIDGHVMP